MANSMKQFLPCIVFSIAIMYSSSQSSDPRDYSWKTVDSITDHCAGELDQPLNRSCSTYYECAGGCGKDGLTLGELLNVAFNKPTMLSSRLYCEDIRYCDGISPSGCAAVNGRTDTELSSGRYGKPHNCIHTHGDDVAAFWWVDLAKAYTITYVWIKERSTSSESRWRNMMGLKVHVDAVVCYSFPDYYAWHDQGNWDQRFREVMSITFEAQCRQPITGTFIRLQKDVTSLDNELKFITVCEVQTFVCPHGTHSPDWKFRNDGGGGVKLPTCSPCPTNCKYPCDNVYGCPHSFPGRPYNLLIHKPTSFLSERSLLYARQAVDGVAYPRDRLCYSSHRSFNRHYLRVHLGGLHVIYSAKVTSFYGEESSLRNLEARVARYISKDNEGQQAGDGLCWLVPGDFDNAEHNETCRTCPANCPRGSFVTFVPEISALFLRLCEVEAFGYPMQEVANPEDACNSQCNLNDCVTPMVCELNVCKSPLGRACASSSHCIGQYTCDSGLCKIDFNGECGGYDPYLGGALAAYCAYGLKCASAVSLCKKDLGGSCNTTADCSDQGHKTVVCDPVGHCKLGLSMQCHNSSQCGAGADCKSSQCTCVEGTTRLPPNEHLCASNVYGMACSQASDCSHANYECTDNTCRCAVGYSLHSSDYSCRLTAGRDCSRDSDCSEGLVCEATGDSGPKKCYAQLDFPCNLKAPTDECAKGYQCETLGQRCKVAAGYPCTRTKDCISTAVCDRHATCKYLRGRSCTQLFKHNLCEDGFVCTTSQKENALKCRIQVGQPCDLPDRHIHCELEAACDSLESGARICRLDINSRCINGKENLCRTGTVCSSVIQACRLKTGQRCQYHGDCAEELCDGGVCRLGKGRDCSTDMRFCRLRSSCSSSRCSCDPTWTVTNTERCAFIPSIWNNPSTQFISSPCNKTITESCSGDLYADCTEHYMCACKEGFVPSDHLMCRLDAGSFCGRTTNVKKHCVSGTVCQNDQCRIVVNQPCDKMRDFCIAGTVCDVGKRCKLIIGSTCQHTNQDSCRSGTVCDILQKCKIPQNSTGCLSDRDCVAGALCKEPNQFGIGHCECDPGQSLPDPNQAALCLPTVTKTGGSCFKGLCEDKHALCQGSRCLCAVGYEIQDTDFSCKKTAGSSCDGDEDCVVDTVCDPEHRICKRRVGAHCDHEAHRPCVKGAVCDLDGICRLDLGQYCLGTEVPCRLGTVCDLLGMCKIVVGSLCNTSKASVVAAQCVAGAICKNYKCNCSEDITESSKGYCNPKAGLLGGKCLSGNTCKDRQSFCNETTNTCQCYEFSDVQSSNLSCSLEFLGALQSDNDLLYSMFVGLFVFLILAAVIALLVNYVLSRSKSDQLMVQLEIRKSSIMSHTQETNSSIKQTDSTRNSIVFDKNGGIPLFDSPTDLPEHSLRNVLPFLQVSALVASPSDTSPSETHEYSKPVLISQLLSKQGDLDSNAPTESDVTQSACGSKSLSVDSTISKPR